MRNTLTTKELYDSLISKPDLHSIPELHDELLIWPLYADAYVRAYCDSYDTCIDIISNSSIRGSLVHWHPDETDMFDELYALGKKGNILVLKKTLFGTSVFYTGPADERPQSIKTGLYFGSTKYDGGQLIFLEQK